MTEKIKVAVMGFGHIGKMAVEAVKLAPDMTLLGVIDLPEKVEGVRSQTIGLTVVSNVKDLPAKPDVVILTVPTRAVEKVAPALLIEGIHTVDCFDMHGDPFVHLRATLDPLAKAHNVAALMGGGVDPGISTMVRALFEIWAPTGLTYVNYGPGMSMGHTVAAKSYPGVKDALSITRPGDPGCHNRDLYLELEAGADFEQVKAAILQDSYFCKDSVRVFQVEDVTPLIDMGHAIHIFRKGGASGIDNQLLTFDTTFHNPASTAQVLVGCARACTRITPGAHTMLEVPLGAFLVDEVSLLMKRLV